MESPADNKIEIRNVAMAYGEYVVLKNINTTINQGEIFLIMGSSGGGKSTLLKE